MGSLSTAAFCKYKTCPSAELILSYTQASVARELRQEMTAHFDACDFCNAERHLLANFPPTDATIYPTAKLPHALYRLAKALLSVPTNAAGPAVEILYERPPLSLTDA